MFLKVSHGLTNQIQRAHKVALRRIHWYSFLFTLLSQAVTRFLIAKRKENTIRWNSPLTNQKITMVDLYIALHLEYNCKESQKSAWSTVFLLFTLLKEASVLSISYHGDINSLFDAITGPVDKLVPHTCRNAPLKR